VLGNNKCQTNESNPAQYNSVSYNETISHTNPAPVQRGIIQWNNKSHKPSTSASGNQIMWKQVILTRH